MLAVVPQSGGLDADEAGRRFGMLARELEDDRSRQEKGKMHQIERRPVDLVGSLGGVTVQVNLGMCDELVDLGDIHAVDRHDARLLAQMSELAQTRLRQHEAGLGGADGAARREHLVVHGLGAHNEIERLSGAQQHGPAGSDLGNGTLDNEFFGVAYKARQILVSHLTFAPV